MKNRGEEKGEVAEIEGVQFVYKLISILKSGALNVVESTWWAIKIRNRGVLTIKTWKGYFDIEYVWSSREN